MRMSRSREFLPSIVEAQQFNKETLETIFSAADWMREKSRRRSLSKILKGKTVAIFFYEPSTRTRISFELAAKAMGANVICTESARVFSSGAKGESLEDTIKTLNSYSFINVIVLRYDQEGGAKRASEFSRIPIINAGDGAGQHPTQAILDVYTIKKHFKDISKLKIAMVGDMFNGRTVRSLCYLLGKFYPPELLYFVSPSRVKMKNDIKEYLDRHDVKWRETNKLDDIIAKVDVVYATRVQKERFESNIEVYNEVMRESENLIIDSEKMRLMKFEAIIMHPLPRYSGNRNPEIAYEVDKNERAKYFEQTGNGLYIRMALLKMMLVGY